MKYAVSNWIYGSEPLEKSFARLARFGYDGIELRGEPRLYETDHVRKLMEKYGLVVSSICGMYPGPAEGERRDLSHPDAKERKKAIGYVKECVDFARELGAPVIIVTPNPVGKTRPLADTRDEWLWAVESVQEAGQYAAQVRILLAIEPINRYETYLINNCDQALRFVADVGLDAVKMMLDFFHTNIEDASPAAAVRRAGDQLIHIHVADSNRQSAGRGHTDFKEIMRSLKEINYRYSLAMEPLPPLPDPYLAIEGAISEEELDQYTEECIRLLKFYEQVV